MDFRLSDEQREFVNVVRKVCQKEFAPRAIKYLDGTWPAENMKSLAEIGVLGMAVPQEYGGSGLSILDTVLVLEEIGAGQNLHIRMITSLIRQHSIVTKPMLVYFRDGVALNQAEVALQFAALNQTARNLTRGRLLLYANTVESIEYQTVGYFSDQFENAQEKAEISRQIHQDRVHRYRGEVNDRLTPAATTTL